MLSSVPKQRLWCVLCRNFMCSISFIPTWVRVLLPVGSMLMNEQHTVHLWTMWGAGVPPSFGLNIFESEGGWHPSPAHRSSESVNAQLGSGPLNMGVQLHDSIEIWWIDKNLCIDLNLDSSNLYPSRVNRMLHKMSLNRYTHKIRLCIDRLSKTLWREALRNLILCFP